MKRFLPRDWRGRSVAEDACGRASVGRLRFGRCQKVQAAPLLRGAYSCLGFQL